MNPEVPLASQVRENRVRQPSVSHLDNVPVLDEFRNVLPDLIHSVAVNEVAVLQYGLVMANDVVHLADMDEAVAVHSRHVRVALRNNYLRRFDGSLRNIHAHAEAQVPVGVWR